MGDTWLNEKSFVLNFALAPLHEGEGDGEGKGEGGVRVRARLG